MNPAVSARPAGWLVGLAGWLAGWLPGWLAGWFGWPGCETMPVTATGLYSTLFLFLSFPFVPLSASSRDIYIGRPRLADSAARYRSFLGSHATYAMVVELSCFYLVPCRRAVFFHARPTHIFLVFLYLISAFPCFIHSDVYTADSFSVRTIHYRLVRVSFTFFIFFPRLLFPFSPSFLLPSTSNLFHSVLSLFLSLSLYLFPLEFSSSFSRLAIRCPPVSKLHIYAA